MIKLASYRRSPCWEDYVEQRAEERRIRGQAFLAMRIRLGLSEAQVAFRLRCNVTSVQAFEAGEPWEAYFNESHRFYSLMLKWKRQAA